MSGAPGAHGEGGQHPETTSACEVGAGDSSVRLPRGSERPWGAKRAQGRACHSPERGDGTSRRPQRFGEPRALSLALPSCWFLCPPVPGAPPSNAGITSGGGGRGEGGHGCSRRSIPVPPRPPGSDRGGRAAEMLEASGGSWRALPAPGVPPGWLSLAGVLARHGLPRGSPGAPREPLSGSAVPALPAAAGGRAAGCRAAGVCQQAGHAQRHGRERADRQAGAAGAAEQDRECPRPRPWPWPSPSLRVIGRARSLVSMPSFFCSGTCRRRVPPRARGSTTGWTGCPTSSPGASGAGGTGTAGAGTSLPAAVCIGFPFGSQRRGGFSFLPSVASSLCVYLVGPEPQGLSGQLQSRCAAFAPAALRAGRPPPQHVLSARPARTCRGAPSPDVPAPRPQPAAGAERRGGSSLLSSDRLHPSLSRGGGAWLRDVLSCVEALNSTTLYPARGLFLAGATSAPRSLVCQPHLRARGLGRDEPPRVLRWGTGRAEALRCVCQLPSHPRVPGGVSPV